MMASASAVAQNNLNCASPDGQPKAVQHQSRLSPAREHPPVPFSRSRSGVAGCSVRSRTRGSILTAAAEDPVRCDTERILPARVIGVSGGPAAAGAGQPLMLQGCRDPSRTRFTSHDKEARPPKQGPDGQVPHTVNACKLNKFLLCALPELSSMLTNRSSRFPVRWSGTTWFDSTAAKKLLQQNRALPLTEA